MILKRGIIFENESNSHLFPLFPFPPIISRHFNPTVNETPISCLLEVHECELANQDPYPLFACTRDCLENKRIQRFGAKLKPEASPLWAAFHIFEVEACRSVCTLELNLAESRR